MLKFVHGGTQDQEEDDHQPSSSSSVTQDESHTTSRSGCVTQEPSPDQQPSTSSSGIQLVEQHTSSISEGTAVSALVNIQLPPASEALETNVSPPVDPMLLGHPTF